MNTPASQRKKPGRPARLANSGQRFNQITVHLPPDLVSALDNEVRVSASASRSELIREACQKYLTHRSEMAQTQSLTRRMRDMSLEERKKVMASAAESLAEYYRTDPEIQEWQALDGEDFYALED